MQQAETTSKRQETKGRQASGSQQAVQIWEASMQSTGRLTGDMLTGRKAEAPLNSVKNG
jgi:hypothetical protein